MPRGVLPAEPTLSVPPTREEVEAFSLYARQVIARYEQAAVVRTRRIAKVEEAYQKAIRDLPPIFQKVEEAFLPHVAQNWEKIKDDKTPKTLDVSGAAKFTVRDGAEGSLDVYDEEKAIAFLEQQPEADQLLKREVTVKKGPAKDWLKSHPDQSIPGARLVFARTVGLTFDQSSQAKAVGLKPFSYSYSLPIPDPSS